jgi:hypothetical protein
VLENGIDLSAAAILKESSLAWAELALALWHWHAAHPPATTV